MKRYWCSQCNKGTRIIEITDSDGIAITIIITDAFNNPDKRKREFKNDVIREVTIIDNGFNNRSNIQLGSFYPAIVGFGDNAQRELDTSHLCPICLTKLE